MYQQLITYLKGFSNPDNETIEEITAKFKPVSIKKNTHLLVPGQICVGYYFINKGILRIYSVGKDGNENTRYLAFEGSFCTGLPSLIKQCPSVEYIEVVENSELLFIPRTDFYWLVDNKPEFGTLYRRILEFSFIYAQERFYALQEMDAEEKLKWLLAKNPKLLTRVSTKIAASMIGISPATFSRLKVEL